MTQICLGSVQGALPGARLKDEVGVVLGEVAAAVGLHFIETALSPLAQISMVSGRKGRAHCYTLSQQIRVSWTHKQTVPTGSWQKQMHW